MQLARPFPLTQRCSSLRYRARLWPCDIVDRAHAAVARGSAERRCAPAPDGTRLGRAPAAIVFVIAFRNTYRRPSRLRHISGVRTGRTTASTTCCARPRATFFTLTFPCQWPATLACGRCGCVSWWRQARGANVALFASQPRVAHPGCEPSPDRRGWQCSGMDQAHGGWDPGRGPLLFLPVFKTYSFPYPTTIPITPQFREAGLQTSFYVGNRNLTFVGEFMFDYTVSVPSVERPPPLPLLNSARPCMPTQPTSSPTPFNCRSMSLMSWRRITHTTNTTIPTTGSNSTHLGRGRKKT